MAGRAGRRRCAAELTPVLAATTVPKNIEDDTLEDIAKYRQGNRSVPPRRSAGWAPPRRRVSCLRCSGLRLRGTARTIARYTRILIDWSALLPAAALLGFRRLPVLTYLHPKNKAALFIAGQPLAGMSAKRCYDDERLFRTILESSPNPDQTGFIIDLRSTSETAAEKVRHAWRLRSLTSVVLCRAVLHASSTAALRAALGARRRA